MRSQKSEVRSQNMKLPCLFLSVSLCLCGYIQAQTPATTTVKDTVYKSDGSLASGTVVITWQAFVSADTKPVFGGTKTVALNNGALAVAMVPNSGGTPSGTSYHVKYYQSGGLFFEETWVVPTSSPIAPPGAPGVANIGTPGSTTYYYRVTATNANGETLLSSSGVTTTSHTTLDTNNYNQITWSAVTGATGYKVYRTNTATAPSGTGSFLVGSTAATSLNDQSNTLQSATIPSLNTTDPRTLSEVRVTAAPSPTVTLAASQVTGTSIVSNPSSTQTIGAPPKAGVIPLQIKGNANDGANVFEIYDSQPQPALQSWFDSSGAFKTSKAASFSTLTAGSVPFAGTGGLLSQDNTNLFWDDTGNRFQVGPRSGFGANITTNYLAGSGNVIAELNNAANHRTSLLTATEDNTTNNFYSSYSVLESAHSSGTRSQAISFEADAYHTGAGTVTQLIAQGGYVQVDAGTVGVAWGGAFSGAVTGGATTTLAAIVAGSNFKSGGTLTNNIGLQVQDQNLSGANNWAVKTGAGKVQFGDDVVADKSLAAKTISNVRFADQFAGTDAGAKIAAAITDLPSTGGVVDARGLEGSQTVTTDFFAGTTKPVILLLGKATFASTVEWRPSSGSQIIGVGRESVITQPNATNLTHILNTQTNNSSRVVIQNLLVDGNGSNQTGGSSLVLLSGSASSSANRIENCWLENSKGHGVFITNGTEAMVRGNRFTNIGNQSVSISYSAATRTNHIIADNWISDYVGFGVGVTLSNENRITGNYIRGILRSGTVDTSGTAVTWVSGDNFSTLRAGHHIKINHLDYVVSLVNSSTSITLTASAGTQTGVAYAAGALEAINLDAAQNNVVEQNVIRDNADSGIVLHAATAGQSTLANVVQGNWITNVAAVGIALEATTGTVTTNSVVGNTLYNVNAAPNAMANSYDVGIRIAASNATRNNITTNTVVDDRGTPLTQYVVALDSVGAGNAATNNFAYGVVNSGTRGASNSAASLVAAGQLGFQSQTGFVGTLSHSATANRTWTLPNATTPLAGTSIANTFSGQQTFTSGIYAILNQAATPSIRQNETGTGGVADWGMAGATDGYTEGSAAGDSVLVAQNGNWVVSARSATKGVLFATGSPSSIKMQLSNAGSLRIGSGSPATKLDVDGAIRSTMTAVTFSATPAFNASLGNSFKMTLTNNVTSSTISNPQTGEVITLLLCQDGTGSRTMTWPTNLKLSGGSYTLTTTINKCDSLTAVYDGSNWYETSRASNL